MALAGSANWGYDSDGQVGPSGGGGHGWTEGFRRPGRVLPEPRLKDEDAPEGRGWALLPLGCSMLTQAVYLG